MRGAIFGDDISTFEQALERNGEYEISNAMIQPIPPQFQLKDNEYQMNFNDRVKLTPLHGESSNQGPKFLSIAGIPRSDDTNKELLDVLGIVLYVGEIRPVRTGNKEVPVRDKIITDDTTQHPLILCARNDLAKMECETFANWSNSFMITPFTAMHVATYKGFSLASTMSTEIISAPQGERAAKLRLWLPTLGKSKYTGSKSPFLKQISLTFTFTWIATTCGRKAFAEKGDTYTCSH
ncbi:Replication protein A 70 kDa DNA-binding subunit B [Bienertia sinuspersici]